MSAHFDTDRMYTYMKGYCMGKNWPDAVSALSFAREQHRDQTRKDGQSYLCHPLAMACHAIAIGLDREDVVAACLLHDVVEDCGVKVDALPVNDDIKAIVTRLTHIPAVPLRNYYENMTDSEPAMLVKLLDRCDNVSTMAGVFTLSKMMDYVRETKDYVLPLIRKVKDCFPNDSDALFVLKYQILAVIDSITATVEAALKVNKTQP